MQYPPQISQINRGLVRGWKCQISGKEWMKTDPTKQEMLEFMSAADAYSRVVQHIQDRIIVNDVTTLLPQPRRTLVDRQNLYNGNTALIAQVEEELGLE